MSDIKLHKKGKIKRRIIKNQPNKKKLQQQSKPPGMKSQRYKQGETQKSELESHVSNVCIFKSLPLAKSFNEKLNGNIKDHNVLESIIFVRMYLVCLTNTESTIISSVKLFRINIRLRILEN